MSFLAKLEMDSKEYNILTVEYDITQRMDQYGRPNESPKGGMVHMTIETGSDINLLEWAVKHSMIKDGKIVFYRRDANSKMRAVEFKDAFCVYLKEIFTADGKNPMVTRLTFSARELKISNQVIKNSWAGMSSNAKDSSATTESEITTFNAAPNS